MKLKITFLAVLFGLPIFAFAATQYAPARTALRAQASDSTAAMMAEYYKKYSVVAPAAPVPSAIPAYMMQVPQYTAPTSYIIPSMAPVSAPSAQPNAASSNNVVAENVVTAKEVVADKGSFKEGKFGLASVYIGSDTVGNYIKATGAAAKNFLRFMIGTTTSNAVEVMRILANGDVGMGTTNPRANLHVVNNISPSANGSIEGATFGLTSNKADSRFAVLDTPVGAELAIISAISSDEARGSRITFTTNGPTGDKGPKMVIDKNGNVGIGTTVPERGLLDVRGTAYADRIDALTVTATEIKDGRGGLSIQTQDISVNNDFCVKDGTKTPTSSTNAWPLKCFQYACPSGSGWVLSQTACGSVSEPGAVSASINSSFSLPTYVASANSVRLASFVIRETTGNEDLQIVELSFDKDANSNFDIQNLRAKIGSQQIGSTQAIVADGGVPIEFTASAPLPIVPKNGSIIVDLYGDILSSTTAGTHTSIFDLLGGAVKGASSGSSIAFPSSVNGQNVVIASGATLTLTTSANSPSSRYLVMGSSDNVLYSLNLAASGAEDVRVTDIILRDVIANNATGIASFNNLRLYDDAGALLVGPVNMTTTGSTGGDIVFSLGSASSLIVPKNSSKTVTLKGDVATFVSGGARSGSSHVFGISSPFNVTAYGKDSSVVASVTGTPSGSAQTVYRTKPTLTSSVVGATTGRTRVAVDEIASMVWSANFADDLTISRVGIKLTGQAVTSGTTPFSVSLIDANTNAGWGNATAQTCTPVAGSQCSVTFNPQFSITRGTNKTVKLRVNSSGFFNNANTNDSLSAVINASSDILWSDGTTNGIGFEPVQIPITLTNVSYQ